MSRVTVQAVAGLAFLLAALAAALFLPAWTLDFWQAWVFLAVFAAAAVAITVDLAARDPALLARRVKGGPTAEPTRTQQLIQTVASLAFLAIFVVASLDHRAGWSAMPAAASLAGDALVALGFAIVFRVFRANTFTSAVVTVDAAQTLVTTGPYAIVRHPMYSGGLLVVAGAPLALGSWWAMLAVAPLAAAIVVRLLDEERLLVSDLHGYADYRTRVRSRLVPHVW